MEKDTVTVYWSPWINTGAITAVNLLNDKPRSLLSTLPPAYKSGEFAKYRQCPAAHELFKNMYVVKHPVDASINIAGTYDDPKIINDTGTFRLRGMNFEGRFSFDYAYGYVFFCEESLLMAQLPPYMHNVSSSKEVHIMPGKYDIGQWFRAVFATYETWDNNRSASFKKDEPAYYLDFQTDKKIIFKQFELNAEIAEIAVGSVYLKEWIQNLPLVDLYNRFKRSGRNKRLLKLIKENLID